MRLCLIAVVTVLFSASCWSQSSKKPTSLKKNVAQSNLKTETKKSESGGKDADDLGKKIIEAFKKNDVSAYLSLVKGKDEKDTKDYFKIIREKLESNGLSDWSKMQYSRVMYTKNQNSDDLGYFKVEFEYGKNFSGVMGGTYAVKHDGRYYLHHAFYNGGMGRN